MAKEPVGSGRRFRLLTAKLAGKPGVKNPAALAATIGRRKFGRERFNKLAQHGQRVAEDKPVKPPRRRMRL